MSPQAHRFAGSLRERKKAKTRATILAHALRLFRDQGYDATTMEAVAAAAEVSASTLFRYFPTKEELVLRDDLDPLLVEAFEAQPTTLSSLQALRGAFHSVFAGLSPEERADLHERMLLVLSVPALRAAMLDRVAAAVQLLSAAIAERTQRPRDDLAVRTLAGAVMGVGMAVMFVAADDPEADLAALFDDAIAHLEVGFAL